MSPFSQFLFRNPVALPPSWSIHNYPEIGFQVILSTFFAAMALSTLRMKFLWTPHMCMLAAGIFCHQDCWRWFFVKLNIQETVVSFFSKLFSNWNSRVSHLWNLVVKIRDFESKISFRPANHSDLYQLRVKKIDQKTFCCIRCSIDLQMPK